MTFLFVHAILHFVRFDGNKLKALREARSFDQTRLAAAARKHQSGVTQSQISRYESGVQQPNGRNVVALAQALGVPADELYEGEDNAMRERRESAGTDDEEDAMAELMQAIRRVVRAEIRSAA